jgi:hypothetical protein
MRTLMIAAAAVLLVAVPVEAQQRRLPVQQQARVTESALMIGASSLDLGELNERFAAFGYPTFDEQFLQAGFAWSTARQRVRLGFEMAGLGRPSATTANNQYRTRLGAGYAMFNLGLDVYRERGLAVQPKVGIGGGAIMLGITDRASPTFDQVLAQPGRGVQLSSGSMLLDASLGLTYRLQPRPTQRGSRALMLGARAGWTQSLLHSEWMRDHTDAPGGPTAGWGGPHFEFMIGRSTRR